MPHSNRGSFYVETMLALLLLGLLATSLLPALRMFSTKNLHQRRYERLTSIARFCSDYAFRWASLSPSITGRSIESYTDLESLEPTNETRVNRLSWAQPPALSSAYLSDHYNVSITFHETNERINSAGLLIHVWYDTNLNQTHDSGELSLSFATVITAKKQS